MRKLMELIAFDELAEVGFNRCPAYIHKDHRWVLCLVYQAQELGWLPKPCKLVMFDAHHDCSVPYRLEDLKLARKKALNLEKLIDVCGAVLNPNDDDWIIGGMELGLIGDAVIFGPEDRGNLKKFRDYEDGAGLQHFIALVNRPLLEFGYQGDLSDVWKGKELRRFWEALGWGSKGNGQFEFTINSEKILLDFDLDLFVWHWSDYVGPWTEKIFKVEFLTPNVNDRSGGWTGSQFINALIDQAGMVTFCTEPDFCGGDENVPVIIERLNRYVFDGKLTFPKILKSDV